jgi:selenium-binding protein 1
MIPIVAKIGAGAKKPGMRRAIACRVARLAGGILLALTALPGAADETALSPYAPRITGQESHAWVLTTGIPGVGDEQDKLVTVNVNPRSKSYGKVVHSLSFGGRNGAQHIDFTDDRRYLWVTGLDSSRILILDVHTDPSAPRLHRTLTDFVVSSGGVSAPRSAYAIGTRMLVGGLSNDDDRGGHTGLVEYTQTGSYVATYRMPDDGDLRGAVKSGQYADGFGYDIQALPRRDIFLTSSFTGAANWSVDLGGLRADKESMRAVGNTVVVWNLHTREPLRILDVPGAPLDIRCALGPRDDWCYTATAFGSKLWQLYLDKAGEWRARSVASIGSANKSLLPVALSISADDRLLWVGTHGDGTVRAFDLADPQQPKLILEQKVGAQLGAIAQSWDGRRLFVTSSFLPAWDKTAAPAGEDLQYFKGYAWDGKTLTRKFGIDFLKEKLGRARQVRLGH